jgi:hypothetical protein
MDQANRSLNSHITVISLPRSGTSSISSIFNPVGSVNEADENFAVTLYTQYSQKVVDSFQLKQYLAKRYKENDFWVDCSSFNFLIISDLISLFPQMKFISLYRDLYSWLNSFIKMLSKYIALYDGNLPMWMNQYGLFYSKNFSPELFTNILNNCVSDLEVSMLKDFCDVWLNANLLMRALLPKDRTIFLNTNSISYSLPLFEDYFNLHPSSLCSLTHTNKSSFSGNLVPACMNSLIQSVQASLDSQIFLSL